LQGLKIFLLLSWITFLFSEIVISINELVPFLLSRIVVSGVLFGGDGSVSFILLFLLLLYSRFYIDALLFYVYSGLKWCPSLLDITVIRDLPRNFRNSSTRTPTFKTSPSATCFGNPIMSLKQILRESVIF